MIDSILPALGRAPNASHCLCRTASAGSIDSTASRILALRAARPSHRVPQHFDELRQPANLALQVTFTVIYPAAPACSRVDSFAAAHAGMGPPLRWLRRWFGTGRPCF